MKITNKYLAGALLSFTLIGCGSDDSGSPADQIYPESIDTYEGAEGDNSPETATKAVVGTSYTKTLFPVLDTDWTAITLESDIKYEISANKLCASCDTKIYLFEADDSSETGYTELEYNDDTIYLDSSVIYTPTETKTYYIHVTPYNEEYGISTYTLNAHVFIDYDEDGYSTYYDCNDQDNSIAPWETEIRDDGIDQDCNGSDLISSETQDSFESDNTFSDASPINFLELGHDEAVYIFQQYSNDIHTIHDGNDVDWFSVPVPAYSAFALGFEYSQESFDITVYAEDGDTVLEKTDWYYANTSDTDVTYYLKVSSSEGNTAYYLPTVYSNGFDVDQDGFYSMDWGSARDCNDDNSEVNPDATEVDNDSIDSNCDGLDNETITEIEPF